ncbi:MAG: hypothetical protein U1E65_30575 [Myxococcota bacterium]
MKLRSQRTTHLQALRAAAGVALFQGVLACGSVGVEDLERRDPVSAADASLGEDDASAEAPDAGILDAGPADLGVVADAGLDCAAIPMNSADYLACCEAAQWSFERGCFAWGPPAPPVFKEVA